MPFNRIVALPKGSKAGPGQQLALNYANKNCCGVKRAARNGASPPLRCLGSNMTTATHIANGQHLGGSAVLFNSIVAFPRIQGRTRAAAGIELCNKYKGRRECSVLIGIV